MPTAAEIASYVGIVLAIAGTGITWIRLGHMTPLEKSQRNASDISAQSVIIKDLSVELEREKRNTQETQAQLRIEIALVRAELAACKQEFMSAKLQWAETELRRSQHKD